jgi:hypothetical protein
MNERIETSAAGHYRTVLGHELSPRYRKNLNKNEWGGRRSLPASRRCAQHTDGVYWEHLTVGVGHHSNQFNVKQ